MRRMSHASNPKAMSRIIRRAKRHSPRHVPLKNQMLSAQGNWSEIEAIGRRRRFEYKSGLLNIVVEPTIKGDGMVYSLYLRMKTEFCGKEKTMAQAKRTAIVRLVGELENTLREVKQEGVKIFSTHARNWISGPTHEVRL